MSPTQPDIPPPPPADGPERTRVLAQLGQVVHAQRAYLTAVARGEGLSAEDALDAAQEAFFTLIARPEAPLLLEKDARELQLFLATITRNIARNQRRLHTHAKPHVAEPETFDALVADDPTAEVLFAAAEERIRLIGCVRTLEKVQRAVVTLRMLDEKPGEDVARELEIAPGHVAVLLHRAKKNLVACLMQAA